MEGDEMFVQANNEFAIDLYHQLASENGGENLFFSPYSMFNVLAMAAEGARGVTAEEMGAVLRFPNGLHRSDQDVTKTPWDLGPLHAGISGFNSWIRSGDEGNDTEIRAQIKQTRMRLYDIGKRAKELERQGTRQEQNEVAEEARKVEAEFRCLLAQADPNEIRVANALWGEKTCPFRKKYVETIEEHYQTGGVFPVDFKLNAEGARQRINDWVEGQTNHRITNLIPPGLLDDLTRLILTNAIYFKGEWLEPFDEAMTRPLDFTQPDRSAREVQMMIARYIESACYAAFNADGSFFNTPQEVTYKSLVESLMADLEEPVGAPKYPDANGFAMLELPYKGRRLSMVLIAPNRYDGLAVIEQSLSAETLNRWIKQRKWRNVHVFLPRFKLDVGYRMTGALQELGMMRAFMNPLEDGGAQFAGMTTSREPDDQLYISEVCHKAFVDVNEKGTEAAAATDVIMLGATGIDPPTVPFTPTFKADRPFIFIIRDTSEGTILFMGRVTRPG